MAHGAQPQIIAAGLPGDTATWLTQRLGEVEIRRADDADEVLETLSRGDPSLLIINHTLHGTVAYDVLSRARTQLGLADLPVIYLLDRTLDSRLGRQLLEQLRVYQLFLNPADKEEVAQGAAQALGITLPLASCPTAVPGSDSPPATDEMSFHTVAEEYASLLIVDYDRPAAERIYSEAVARGMHAEIASSPAAGREILKESRPDVVLLDLAFSGASDDGLVLLEELSTLSPPIPVLVMTARDSFIDRVQVASLGGRGFLQKTTPPGEVVDAVSRLFQQVNVSEMRVLAVDDDRGILSVLTSLLDSEGIRLSTLDDPLRFWDALEQNAPDLLILDVDMPRLSGIELCRVVRNDARWSALPILLLTANADADTVRKVFSAGADDFVSKPIVGPELVTKITNRLERTQLYRSMAETDPLTGVTNRRKAMQLLDQFLRLAKRHGQPLSLALLDIDYFKQINDRLGHGTGDIVLQQLGKLLIRHFRSEDVVARWGGEEFLVGMYGMNRVDGVQRLSDLLETLRHESMTGPHGERIRITFSAGVAQYPEDGTDVHTLYRAADEALYRAKESGRDRVLAVGWHTDSPETSAQTVDVLIVDDDEVLGPLLVHSLETKGYRTQWIKDGESAALQLGGIEPSVEAQVIVLDADVPGLDGMGLLRRLARDGALRRTRLLLLTAGDGDGLAARAIELGAFDHVTKPFSLPVLIQRVRRAMEIL